MIEWYIWINAIGSKIKMAFGQEELENIQMKTKQLHQIEELLCLKPTFKTGKSKKTL